jgi:glycosyltransferase involved in cell wall biosynthesis
MPPKVSVIIPTYNRADLIGRAIDSILAQTLRAVEILVIDDGSTDNTRKVVGVYGEPVRYIYQDNQGISSARNRGIELATGEYIAFLDSDDYFLLNNLEEKIRYLLQNPTIDWVYSDWQYFDIQGNPLGFGSTKFNYTHKVLSGWIFPELISHRNFISPCTVVLKKVIFDHIGLFDITIPSQEEYDLFLRISLKYPIGYLDKVLVHVISHPGSLSSDFSKWVQGNTQIVQKMEALLPEDFLGRDALLTRMQADKFTFMGRDFMQRGMLVEAFAAFWQSIRILPCQKRIYWLLLSTIIGSISKSFRAILKR